MMVSLTNNAEFYPKYFSNPAKVDNTVLYSTTICYATLTTAALLAAVARPDRAASSIWAASPVSDDDTRPARLAALWTRAL